MPPSIPSREVGFSMCKLPLGGLTKGPTAIGTPVSVNIPVACPPSTQFQGLFHTHPKGVPFPSATDVRSAMQVRAKEICIRSDSHLNCFGIEDGFKAPRKVF